ncbi:MAG: radical SAM protein [Bacteroidales bacterium]|nr:radical SAM protein [Bacteroidales bacterium]
MSTIIYPSPIFGPIHSRRLGISLGINLLPADGKACTFDCIYCECGYNADHRPHTPLPTREQVREALEKQLQSMKENGPTPNVLTFAGNGEPTSHPHFPEIIADTVALRDKYFPEAKVSVLSNATQTGKEKVRQALLKVDNNIQKLDTVNESYILELDRPTGPYSVQQVIENLKKFKGHVIIQTMFLKGLSPEGRNMDNTTDDFVLPWLQAVKEIQPEKVMIYTIDRETPDQQLQKATHEELDRIVDLLRAEGLEASASY